MNDKNVEIAYIIDNLKFDADLDESFFDKKDIKYIKHLIDLLSKSICIDKTYVECKQNKHSNVFLIDTGWQSMKELLFETEFSKKLPSNTYHSAVIDAFITMARCYILDMLINQFKDTYTNMHEHIELLPNITSKFNIIICHDFSNEWKNYKGDWTNW